MIPPVLERLQILAACTMNVFDAWPLTKGHLYTMTEFQKETVNIRRGQLHVKCHDKSAWSDMSRLVLEKAAAF